MYAYNYLVYIYIHTTKKGVSKTFFGSSSVPTFGFVRLPAAPAVFPFRPSAPCAYCSPVHLSSPTARATIPATLQLGVVMGHGPSDLFTAQQDLIFLV